MITTDRGGGVMLPDNTGTPGPWKAASEAPVTRETLAGVLRTIGEEGATAHQVGTAMEPPGNGSCRRVDVSLQLLKRWGLIKYQMPAMVTNSATGACWTPTGGRWVSTP